jgi:superfamily II DNA or RNA helicase
VCPVAKTNLVRQLEPTAVRPLFGKATYQRGASYAREGRVVELELDEGERTFHAVVLGSDGRRYRTTVALTADDPSELLELDAYCTCPVGIDCKHAAAVLIAGRSRLAPVAPVAPATPEWERALTPLSGHSAATATGVPLALQFDVVTVPGERAAAGPDGAGARQRVRLRPVVPGKAGNWVRTGVSWADLQHEHLYPAFTPAHRSALRALLSAHAAAPRPRYSSYHYGGYGAYGQDTAVYLDEFGPSLWPLLEQLADTGIELVPARATYGPVALSGTTAVATLDLTEDSARGGATLSPRVLLGESPLAPETVSWLGSPPHGVVVHQQGLLLAALDRPLRAEVAELVRDNHRLQIPGGDLGRFLADYYPRLQRSLRVVSSDATVTLPEVAPPRLSLHLTYREGHRVGLEWGFEYAVGDDVRTHPLDIEPAWGAYDPAAERAVLRELERSATLTPQLWTGDDHDRRLLSPVILAGMDAVQLVEDVVPALLADEQVVVHEHGERPDFRMAEDRPLVRIAATDSAEGRDWFDLDVTVFVDGEEVPFNDLFTALARGDSHMLLPSGTWFSLDDDDLHQMRRLIEEARSLQDREPGPLRLSRYQAGLWDELRALGVVEAQSERWATIVTGLLDVGGIESYEQPAGLAADLRPYQLDGYRWLSFLHEHELGGILADDMGLGKTVQTLALLCHARETGRMEQPVLVVAPTSVVNNWATEAARFAPGLRVAAVTETESRRGVPLSEHVGDADVVVTSYALFRIDYDAYANLAWSGLVLDEAQFVKNHQAKTYQCARRLPASFKLAITGTPLENSLMDMWALLSIVAPGLFPSPQRFSEYYRKPIERGDAPDLLTSLRRRIRPLILRRTKELVATELPPKQEQLLEVELTPRHRKIYDTHLQRERQKILGLIGDLDKNRFTILKSLTLLRQLSLDPALVDAKYDNVRSSKADVFLEHLEELAREGHRALVFSQFTGFLRRIRDHLDARGVRYSYLDGRTRNRERAISAFKDGDAPVFLISIKAGGFGLNLTEADYCFVLDPWWNPAVEAQAIDRTHRIGQDKTVMVYQLVSSGTIEEKVMELKARKAELFRSVMDDGLMSAPLTADDIKALIEP